MDATLADWLASVVSERGRMPLSLAGYGHASVWGWDKMGGYLFAQLWKNSDDSDGPPAVWITPGKRWPATTTITTLAEYIATATDTPIDEVLLAMAGEGDTGSDDNFEDDGDLIAIDRGGVTVTMNGI